MNVKREYLYRGPRKHLGTRVPLHVAERIEHLAAAADLTVSEYLARRLAAVAQQEYEEAHATAA